MYTETATLTPTPPFNFAHTLRLLSTFAPMEGEQATTTTLLTRAVSISGQPVAFQLSSQGTVELPKLTYQLLSEHPIEEKIKQNAIDRIRFFLSLDDDLRPLYQLGLDDPDFAPIIEALYGYHQVKFLTPFEIACWSILVQRNPLKIAHRMKTAITANYGDSIQIDGIRYPVFPEAARLIDVSESELLTAVHNSRKASQLLNIIQAFNQIDEHFLRTAPYAEVESWLRSIKGIGEWSTYFILVRGLGRMEKISSHEKPLLEAASRAYGHGRDLSSSELEQLAQRYGAYQGYWSHYLRIGA